MLKKSLLTESLLPDSILLSIFLAHCTKASSTFSPVSALVSKNISSKSDSKQNAKLCLEGITTEVPTACWVFSSNSRQNGTCYLKTTYFCKYRINTRQYSFLNVGRILSLSQQRRVPRAGARLLKMPRQHRGLVRRQAARSGPAVDTRWIFSKYSSCHHRYHWQGSPLSELHFSLSFWRWRGPLWIHTFRIRQSGY